MTIETGGRNLLVSYMRREIPTINNLSYVLDLVTAALMSHTTSNILSFLTPFPIPSLPLSLQDKQGAKTLEDKLKADPQLKEASRATILECDETECAQAQCTQDRNGNWHCEGGLEGDRENSKTQVLMHSDEDD